MKVLGSQLERANGLVRQLEQSECGDHSDLPEVHLIVAQDGSVQYSLNVVCCEQFRSTIREAVEVHNAKFRT